MKKTTLMKQGIPPLAERLKNSRFVFFKKTFWSVAKWNL